MSTRNRRVNRNTNKRTKFYHPYNNEEIINVDECNINKLNKNFDPFKKIFNLGGNDTDVYRESNHIYFKTDVNTESIDKLYKNIRSYQKEVEYIKMSNCSVADVNIKDLYIHITSYGGSLHEAYLAYDIIKRSSITINTIIEGYAASAGTIMSISSH